MRRWTCGVWGRWCLRRAKDFVARCLDARPDVRPTATQLLRHPWVVRRSGDEEGGGGAVDSAVWSTTDRISRVLSDAPPHTQGGAAAAAPHDDYDEPPEPHPGGGGAAARPERRGSVRRSLSASAADLDFTRPTRSKTGRLEVGSRTTAAAVVGHCAPDAA